MTDSILVVGGGFAGFWAALAAKRVAGARAEVTVVSRDPVLEVRPRLYEASPETLGVEILPLLQKAGVRFLQGEAVGIDVDGRAVDLASGERLDYTRLIVATGSSLRRPPIPGAETVHSIDTQADAIAFDRRLAEIVETVADPSIVVVGAGFTGLELALELRDRLVAHGAEAQAERLRILLVDRAETVGPELGAGPRPLIEAALAEARVELRLGASVAAMAPHRLTFADGTVLEADAIVLTTGMAASPFVANVPGSRDPLGRLIVEGSLRAPAAPEIFVAGDAAAADTGDGHLTLQSCQHALQLGRWAGENAAHDLLGMPMRPYAQLRYVTCLDLGRSGAILTGGWDRTVQHNGAETKALKRRINTIGICPPIHVSGQTLLALSSTNREDQTAPDPPGA